MQQPQSILHWVSACGLLVSSCALQPAANESACFSPVLEGASTTWGNGRQLQGKTDQGTSFNGAARQARDRQGTRPQDGVSPCDAAERSCVDPLHALNGALLRQGESDVLLRAGVLVDSHGLPVQGALEALSRDGASYAFDAVVSELDSTHYELRVHGQPLCADGQAGVFVAGRWDASGQHIQDARTVTFACADGVIAKCVRWGYAPWRVDPALHQACTRLARADYCGDGSSWTREGTVINLYDSLGIQVSEPTPELSFEAAWGPDGALCVNQPRYLSTRADGSYQLPACWSELPRCTSETWRTASSAWLANDSAHEPLTDCAD